VPASSRHRISLARVYTRLERYPEGLTAAGVGRAIAKSPAERDEAQRALADLARATAPSQAVDAAASPASAPPGTTAAAAAGMTTTITLEPASGASGTGVRDVGSLINDCYDDNTTCARAPPVIEADCKAANAVTSTPACRRPQEAAAALTTTGQPLRARSRMAVVE
jgi:hypothetical protein